MPHSYTRSELTEYFFEALETFNDCLNSDISKQNVLLEFFKPTNGVAVYEGFCRAHFPKMLKEPYKEEGYFESFGAQAFVNDTEYGVLIREDIDFTLGEVLQMFLHEISHLYCTRNEIDGCNFFGKYCMGSEPEDGMMNAGYAIWREAVADIMADSIISEYATITLSSIKGIVKEYYGELSASNPDSKKAMSLIIVYIMISREVASTRDWNVANRAIKRSISIDEPLLEAMLKLVFDQLHRSPFWEITPEFIMTLGETYVSLLSHILLKGFLQS